MCKGIIEEGRPYALSEILLRLHPDRRGHLRLRRGHRPRPSPQTEEETLPKIPKRIRAHPALSRGEDPLEMSAARGRNRTGCAARHAPGQAQSDAQENLQ